MTKMKSKKMTKSTFAIIIMGIIMVAMLAFGGTFAYFTATADKVKSDDVNFGIIALGDSTVTIAETVKNVLPGETIEDVEFKVVDKSNRASYIFVTVAGTIKQTGDDATEEPLEVSLTTGTVLKSVEIEGEDVFYILTEDHVDNTAAGEDITFKTSITLGEGLGNEYQGATLSVSLKADSIQAATFADVESAYTAWKAAQA